MMFKIKTISPLIVLLICLFSLAEAQNIYTGNPADMEMLEAAFSNPALNAFIKDRLVLAMTSHQTGVAGKLFSIRSNIVGYHFPWKMRGLAAGMQFMNAGLYSQNNFRVSYGRRMFPWIAFGANLDIFTRSFDQNEFFLFNPEDPVFQNGTTKWGASAGLGVVFVPHRAFVFGLSLEHLNQPNLAMGNDTALQPVYLSTGMKMYMGKFSLFSSVNALEFSEYSIDGLQSASDMLVDKAQFGVELPVSDYGAFRFSAGSRAFHLEGEAFIFKSLYFNYRYEYPLSEINIASQGTHRFGFIYDFGRQPPLPSLPPLPELPKYRTDIKAKSASPKGQFFLCTEEDSVHITVRRVSRNIGEDIPRHTLGLLFPEDLGDVKGLWESTPIHRLPLMEVRDPTILPRELYSPQYRGTLEGIAFQMRSTLIPTEMITYAGAERRGNTLVNLMTGNRMAVPRDVPIYSPENLPLTPEKVTNIIAPLAEVQQDVKPEIALLKIVPIYKSSYTGGWYLEVRTSKDQVIFQKSGVGIPPPYITWDWRMTAGDVIPHGIYYFVFKSFDKEGNPEFSTREYFKVIHQRKSLDITVTREPRVGGMDADKYILILGAKTSASHRNSLPNPQNDNLIDNPNREDGNE